MKTKIIIKEKTLLERVKEIASTQKLFITQKGGELTLVFDTILTATQIQKIKDLLGIQYNVVVEEIEKFPEAVFKWV